MTNKNHVAQTIDCLPTGIFPAGTVASIHSHYFDEIASLPPLWEQNYSQIQRGQFSGDLFMALSGNLCIGFEQFSVGLMIRGSIPKGSAMVCIPFGCSDKSTYQGERLSDRSALIVFSGEELDFRSNVSFDMFTLVLERNLFEQHAHRILGRPLESVRRNAQGLIRNPAHMQQRLRGFAGKFAARQEQLRSDLLAPVSAAALERELCDEILGGLEPRLPQRHNIERAEVAWITEEYLRTHLGQDISIPDLCRVTGASERSVHIAFREHIGSTPKAYQKMLLLNAVRRHLRSARAGTTVTDIAIRWGLLHFGWFAHDYKAMFGESPHETLHKSARQPRSV